MIILYIGLAVMAAVMISGAVCIVFKAGEEENICNYDYVERDKKQ